MGKRAEGKKAVDKAIKDARDTPIGTIGISTDDALEAIKRGKEGQK